MMTKVYPQIAQRADHAPMVNTSLLSAEILIQYLYWDYDGDGTGSTAAMVMALDTELYYISLFYQHEKRQTSYK